ncbi:hypothetical protein [Anaerotignum sp.]
MEKAGIGLSSANFNDMTQKLRNCSVFLKKECLLFGKGLDFSSDETKKE